ncbi:albumin [Phyllostomus discolor]|uniref:Albumin n=1 Tax=Phyllostomus discolor TaxID=89673 RepID=A0A834BIK0_9CHIR|nr:albumin [Phyllostomus discolor]
MKWVTFICLLFLFSSAYSRGVFRRDAHKSEIAHRFKDLGEENFKGLVLVAFSQNLQKTPFDDHVKLAKEVTDFAKTCVADESAENCGKSLHILFAEKLCGVASLRETYGELADCCSKPEAEKHECFLKYKDDDPSLPALVRPEPDALCASFQENTQKFLGTYQYETTLEKCCATADPHACYSKVFDEFKPLVEEPTQLVKKNCEEFEKLGEYGFQNELIIRYTKRAPQVSTPTLVDISRKLGKVGTRCCKLPEAQRMGCAEDFLSVVLNGLCVRHEKAPVSERVTKCCTESLVNRRPCFSALELDATFVPKEFVAETFTFHADVCTLPEHEQQIKKQTALVELLKHKPKASEEKLKTVLGNFSAFVQKCCAAADKEACFSEEGPKLVASSQAELA